MTTKMADTKAKQNHEEQNSGKKPFNKKKWREERYSTKQKGTNHLFVVKQVKFPQLLPRLKRFKSGPVCFFLQFNVGRKKEEQYCRDS